MKLRNGPVSLSIVCLAIIFVYWTPTLARDNDIEITGVWCGKWDLTYAVCFDVEQHDKIFSVVYRWEENLRGGLQKQTLEGRLLNVNTLDMSGKILIVDLKDHNKAIAMGIFENHSRIAFLTRIK